MSTCMFQARTISPTPTDVWSHDTLSMEDWDRCDGMNCNEWEIAQQKIRTLLMNGASAEGIEFDPTVWIHYLRICYHRY